MGIGTGEEGLDGRTVERRRGSDRQGLSSPAASLERREGMLFCL